MSSANSINTQGKLLLAARYTANEVTTPDQDNFAWRGVTLVINVTAFVNGSYIPVIQGKDPVSSEYYNILAGIAIDGTGMNRMSVYPGIYQSEGYSVSATLPKTWRLLLAGMDSAPDITFSVGLLLQG